MGKLFAIFFVTGVHWEKIPGFASRKTKQKMFD